MKELAQPPAHVRERTRSQSGSSLSQDISIMPNNEPQVELRSNPNPNNFQGATPGSGPEQALDSQRAELSKDNLLRAKPSWVKTPWRTTVLPSQPELQPHGYDWPHYIWLSSKMEPGICIMTNHPYGACSIFCFQAANTGWSSQVGTGPSTR